MGREVHRESSLSESYALYAIRVFSVRMKTTPPTSAGVVMIRASRSVLEISRKRSLASITEIVPRADVR